MSQQLKKKSPPIIMLALLGLGLILGASQIAYNSVSYVRAFFTRVEHPTTYDFSKYGLLLRKHVINGRVNYPALRQDPLLAEAVGELARINPDRFADKLEGFTFWINAYNLLALKNIVDEWPVADLEKISRRLSLRQYVVGGRARSIQDIRSDEVDSRISSADPSPLFLLCNGSLGDPPLQNHVITSATYRQDIESAKEAFLSKKENVHFDQDTNIFYLSPYFFYNRRFFSPDPFKKVNAMLPPSRQVNLKSWHVKTQWISFFDWRVNLVPAEEDSKD